MSRLLAAALAAIALAGASASDARVSTRARGYRILLVSNRDGNARGYSVRPDGSRLTPLLPRGRAFLPAALSGDGRTIAYSDNSGIYVSRADGTGLHRVVPGRARSPALSPDGRLLAFTEERSGVWIIGTNGRGSRRMTRRADGSPAWSPDGKTLAFVRSIGDFAGTIVVQPLHGAGHVVAWGDFEDASPQWSPDRRWIAYVTAKDEPSSHHELWVVRPNGARSHRVARDVQAFSWSPRGGRLAFAVRYGEDVAVTGVDGRGVRLGLRGLYISTLTWLPDGRHLALTASSQIWIVGSDGRGLRRVTSAGDNRLVGWTRLAPVLPQARPIPPTERVVGARSLASRAPIVDIAADGPRVAVIVGATRTDCVHVTVWRPSTKSVERVSGLPSPCGGYRNRWGGVALGATRAAWHVTSCCGHTEETDVLTATLARPKPVGIAEASYRLDTEVGALARRPVGDGSLVAFVVEESCDADADLNRGPGQPDQCPPGRRTGDIAEATAYRIGGPGPCPFSIKDRPRACTPIAKANGELTLLAVDAGRIVVGTESGVSVLTASGRVLRDFAVTAKRAALSGSQLALETDDAIAVYDIRSGRRTAAFPALSDLQDLESGLLVVAPAEGVIVRKLSNGRTTTFQVRGTGRAQLERPGLFLAGSGRVTFTPMRELLRRLGG